MPDTGKRLNKPVFTYVLWSVGCFFVVAVCVFLFLALHVRNVSEGAASGSLYIASDASVVRQLLPGYSQQQSQIAPSNDLGYGIFSNRLQVVLCRSKEDAQWVIDRLISDHRMEGATASLVENVSIEPSFGNPLGKEEALMVIESGTDNLPYKVDASDSVPTICDEFSMTQQEYVSLNTSGSDGTLIPGQLVTVKTDGKPLLRIKNVVVKTETKTLAYTTETVNDDDLYKGQSVVKQAGVTGIQTRTTTVTYIDGAEVSRKTTDFQTTKEPVKKIIHKGTKTPPQTGKGPSLVWPVSGKISSPFGTRWGKSHEGIDISVSTGTKVKAAAGGVVKRACNNGGYGLFVEIDHGGGWITRYGHNSKLLVSAGDTIKQGDIIALSGNTGNSTGPHVHFEVRKNGKALNPALYLP